jgi:hypothetical protein
MMSTAASFALSKKPRFISDGYVADYDSDFMITILTS